MFSNIKWTKKKKCDYFFNNKNMSGYIKREINT